MKKITLSAAAVVTTSILIAAGASAHVGAGPATLQANSSQEITLSIGHGCVIPNVTPETYTDTTSLTVDIPAGVTSVRGVSNPDFPNLTYTKDTNGNVTNITWAKAAGAELNSDSNYYKLVLRGRLPNAPFTKLYFKSHQVCKAPGKATDWVALPTDPPGGEPAAEVTILPAKAPGWNKYTVPVAVTDLSAFFKDAQIVWKGSAAYSANAIIAEQIKGETGVTALTSLAANDEIFVKW